MKRVICSTVSSSTRYARSRNRAQAWDGGSSRFKSPFLFQRVCWESGTLALFTFSLLTRRWVFLSQMCLLWLCGFITQSTQPCFLPLATIELQLVALPSICFCVCVLSPQIEYTAWKGEVLTSASFTSSERSVHSKQFHHSPEPFSS